MTKSAKKAVRIFAKTLRELQATRRLAHARPESASNTPALRATLDELGDALAKFAWLITCPVHDGSPESAIWDDLPIDAETLAAIRAVKSWLVSISRMLQSGTFDPSAPAPATTVARSDEEKRQNAARLGTAALDNRATVPGTAPMRVLVALADKCNYSCVTCYQSESQNFAQFDLSSSDLGRLADLFEYAFQVSIGGFGEPLLSPAASGVLTAAKSSGAKTSITTNGSMVRRISGLALDRIEVSLDAVTADLLNSIRRGADIRVIYDNLAALSDDERAKVAFNVVVTKLNVREITLIVALAHRLGLGEVCLQTFNPYLPWHADMILTKDDLDVLDAQVSLANDLFAGPTVIRDLVVRENSARSTNAPAPAVLEAIGEIPYPRHAKPDDRDVVDGLRSDYAAFAQRGASFLQYLTNNRDRILAYYRLDAHENASGTATDRSVPYCMEPFGTMVVNADGSVNPCCKLTWPMGNINDDSIDAIWNGERFRELRTTVLTRENLSPVCQGCRDANRFANLPLMLVAMKEQGGIPDVAVPDDLHLPPSIANLSDVRELLGEPAS